MRVHKKCQMSVHRDIEKNEKAVFGEIRENDSEHGLEQGENRVLSIYGRTVPV